MWPFYTLSNEIVTISFDTDNLVCSWITSSPTKKFYILKAYQRIPITNFSCLHGMICNPSFIGSKISSFIKKHHLENSFFSLSASGSYITEFALDMPTSSPKYTDFPLQKLNRLMWDYRYLYPKDNAHHTMYICGISRQLLAQYQLLAIHNKLNTIIITTEFITHLEVYKHLYAKAFRRAQLAYDLQNNHHQFLNILHTETLARTLTIDPSISLNLEIEKPWLFTALGLFLLGRQP